MIVRSWEELSLNKPNPADYNAAITQKIVIKYLDYRYPKLLTKYTRLQIDIKSPQWSADKIQTSFTNTAEDTISERLDVGNEIDTIHSALDYLAMTERPILKMLYIEHRKRMEVAHKLGMIARDYLTGVEVPSTTYKDSKRRECIAFADIMESSGFNLFYKHKS